MTMELDEPTLLLLRQFQALEVCFFFLLRHKLVAHSCISMLGVSLNTLWMKILCFMKGILAIIVTLFFYDYLTALKREVSVC